MTGPGEPKSCGHVTITLQMLALTFEAFCSVARALREDQPLRLLLNLLFYHFNHSEPTYKSQCIKLPDVIAACNQLNVNALN